MHVVCFSRLTPLSDAVSLLKYLALSEEVPPDCEFALAAFPAHSHPHEVFTRAQGRHEVDWVDLAD